MVGSVHNEGKSLAVRAVSYEAINRAEDDELVREVDRGDLCARAEDDGVLCLELCAGAPLELGRVCHEGLAQFRAVYACQRRNNEYLSRRGYRSMGA